MPKQITTVCSHILKFDGPGSVNAENQASNAKRLIDAGVDMIEMDIQITKDGIPVLFHDNDLDSKTNSTGQIKNKTWQEVSLIKYKGSQAPISRLDEVTNYLKTKSSKTILQLDKCDDKEIEIIYNLGLFKGIEKNILCKKSSFDVPAIVKKAGVLYMPIIPSNYVGKMNSESVIDEIVSKATGSNFLEAQFSDSDTLLINGTLSRKLAKIGCQLLVVAVGGAQTTNGVSFRGDSKNQWSKMVNPMGAGVIMTNSPTRLQTFLKTAPPIDLDSVPPQINNIPVPSQVSGLTGSIGLTSSFGTQSGFSNPNVSPNPVIEQDSSRGNNFADNANPQSNTNIGQIQKLTSIFEPTIKPTQIKVDINPIQDKLSSADIEHITSEIGYKPLVYYYGLPLAYTDIRKLHLYHTGILPAVEIIYQDTWGLFKEDAFPPDNAIITVFINSKSDNLRSILMDFKILTFKDNGEGSYTIVGTCDVPELYLKRFKSYRNKSSYEALQDVAKECQLGFSSNVKNSNDVMTYINPGYMVKDFIQSTIENSYISDRSFQHIYIDFYYHLCYVDIYSELERDNSNDVAIDTEIVAERKLDDKKESTDDSKVSPLFLSSDKSFTNTNSFIQKFEILNNSTQVSVRKAYRMKTKFYDTINKMLLIFNIESQTSDGSKSIILKSTPNDDTFFKDNSQSVYLGKQDIINNGVGNVHKNYHYASIQNRQNLDDITKLSAKLYLPNNNFNLHIYQKVNIIFIPQNPASADQLFFKRITGDWLITDIEFNYQDNSHYQVVTVIKRELGLLPSEMGQYPRKSSASQNNYQRNSNELAPSDVQYSNNVGTSTTGTTGVQNLQNTTGETAFLPEQQYVFGQGTLIYDVDKVIQSAKQRGIKTKFEDSLGSLLKWSQSNISVQSVSNLAYLLATAGVESDYSLQRWEADYACKSTGVPYSDKPCKAALDYYASTKNKKNYFKLGVDSRGLPYFGRGLIQLTGKGNYETYGKKIGVDLVANPELALKPEISFRIALAYLTTKRSEKLYAKNGKSRSTFDMAEDGDLKEARLSVNAGTNGLEDCNSKYKLWLDILTPLVNLSNGSPAIASVKTQPQAGDVQTVQNQPSTQPSAGVTNIVIGDSQTPSIAAKSTKYQLYGQQMGESSLWKSGESLSWLLKAVQKIQPTTSIKNVAISIGTNGGFNANENISGLVTECKRAFPNAKLFVVKGSWGWGGNKNVTEQQVNNYYAKFATEGVEIVPTPIGNMAYQLPEGNHPDQNKTVSFVQIGKDLDGTAIA